VKARHNTVGHTHWRVWSTCDHALKECDRSFWDIIRRV